MTIKMHHDGFILGTANGDFSGKLDKVPSGIAPANFTAAEKGELRKKFERGIRKAFQGFEREYGITGRGDIKATVARFDFAYLFKGLEQTIFFIHAFPMLIDGERIDACIAFARDGSVSPLVPTPEGIMEWGGKIMRETKDPRMLSGLVKMEEGNC